MSIDDIKKKVEGLSKEEAVNLLLEQLSSYQEAYDILMGYWNYIPDEDKDEVNEDLNKLGL